MANMRRQLRRLGLAHDMRRSVSTHRRVVLPLDPVDLRPDLQRLVRRGPGEGPTDRRAGERVRERSTRHTRRHPVDGMSRVEQRRLIDSHRLAYLSEAPVNWCPGLGTILANEEVTAEGRSDIGNYPVFKKNMRQWMMRITATPTG